MADSLQGTVALVTGGAGGIGAAVCRLLAAHGVRVAVADLDEERGRAVAGEVDGMFVRTDVTRRGDLRDAVSAVTARWGRLDTVGLNAGTTASGSGVDPLDEDSYRRIAGVNLDGVVFGLAAALPALRRSGGGSVVATASLAGLVPMPGDPLYTMTKSAVVGLVRALAPVLAADNVRINALCPGFVDTPMIARVRHHFVAAGFPLLTPEDVARAFLTVVDDQGSGQAWFVQPGRHPAPYQFRGVPGPKVDGQPAPRPPSLTDKESRA